MDDVAIWGVFALILMDWERVGRQLGFLLAFAVVGYGLRKLMAWMPERDRWYAGLIWLAACGFGADGSGLHFMAGAFLAGSMPTVPVAAPKLARTRVGKCGRPLRLACGDLTASVRTSSHGTHRCPGHRGRRDSPAHGLPCRSCRTAR